MLFGRCVILLSGEGEWIYTPGCLEPILVEAGTVGLEKTLMWRRQQRRQRRQINLDQKGSYKPLPEVI